MFFATFHSSTKKNFCTKPALYALLGRFSVFIEKRLNYFCLPIAQVKNSSLLCIINSTEHLTTPENENA